MKNKVFDLCGKFGLKKILISLTVFLVLIFTVASFMGGSEEGGDVVSVAKNENDKSSGSGEASGDEEAGTAEPENKIFVDVQGEVKKSGVYPMPEGARVFEVIKKAGGLKKNADISNVNRAKVIIDGEKIFIPKKTASISGASGQTEQTGQTGQGGENELININTADSLELQKINGVGPATAEKIITFREQEGGFSKLEDLLNVSGIGEKTFEKLKAYVCI